MVTTVAKPQNNPEELRVNPSQNTEYNDRETTLKDVDLRDETYTSYSSMTFAEFCANPPDNTEWVDGKIIEKGIMGTLHGELEVDFVTILKEFIRTNQMGGKVMTEAPCLVGERARKPDISYASAQQKQLFPERNYAIFPECFALIAEVISPTDIAEEVFSKAREYLQAGAEEVWLIFPENKLIFVVAMQDSEIQWQLFANNQSAVSPKVLVGFSINVNDFFTF